MNNNLKKIIFVTIPIVLIFVVFLLLSLNNKNLIYNDNNIKIYYNNEELVVKNKNNFDLDFRLIKDTIKINKVEPKSNIKVSLNEGYGDYNIEIRNTDYRLEVKLTQNHKDPSIK